MTDLVACPVCTLYLHKGMSLAEHLDTHPKEQVIKALVSLATGTILTDTSIGTNIKAQSSSNSITHSLALNPFQSLSSSCQKALQNSNSLQKSFSVSSDKNSTTSANNLFTQSSSSSTKITGFPKSLYSSQVYENSFTRQQQTVEQNIYFDTNRSNFKSHSAISSNSIAACGRNGRVIESCGSYFDSALGRSSSLNLPNQLQNLLNAKAKHLPPPPAYGQAISQLRSQNNLNFSRVNATKSLANLSINSKHKSNINNYHKNGFLALPSSSSYNVVNQQTVENYYPNTNSFQETLDFSLPKQNHQTSETITATTTTKLATTSSYTPPTQNENSIQTNRQSILNCTESLMRFNYQHNPSSSNQIKTISNLETSEKQNENESSRTPSPICLITSVRSTNSEYNQKSLNNHLTTKSSINSSSILRFAETPPPAAQYIERDTGDFIVQESPRHIVECIEKDNGEFSVVEKVIRSPPSIVSVNQHILEDESPNNDSNSVGDVSENLHEVDNFDNSNNQIELHDSKVQNKENDIENEIQLNVNQIKTEKYDMSYETNFDSKTSDHDENTSSSSKRKSNSKGVKVLSNVKLDPNMSLEIVENIQKCSTEEFWTGIVNTIKNEDSEKSSNYSNAMISASGNSSTEIVIDDSAVDQTTKVHCSTADSTDSHKMQMNQKNTITNSVNRLTANKQSIDNEDIPVSESKNLDDLCVIQNEKNISKYSKTVNLSNEPIPSTSTGEIKEIGISSSNKKSIYKKSPKKLIVKLKNPLPQNLMESNPNQTELKTKDKKSMEIVDKTDVKTDEQKNGKSKISTELCPIQNFSANNFDDFTDNNSIIEDTEENTINNMMEQIVNEENNSLGTENSEKVNKKIILSNENSNFNLKSEPDFINTTTMSDNFQESESVHDIRSSAGGIESSLPSCAISSNSSVPDNNLLVDSDVDSKNNHLVCSKTLTKTKPKATGLQTENFTKTVFIIEEINDYPPKVETKTEQHNQYNMSSFADFSITTANQDLSKTIHDNTRKTIPSLGNIFSNNNQDILHQSQKNSAEATVDINVDSEEHEMRQQQPNKYQNYSFNFLCSSASSSLASSSASIQIEPSVSSNTNLFTNDNSNQELNCGKNGKNKKNTSEFILNSNSSAQGSLVDKRNRSETSKTTSFSTTSILSSSLSNSSSFSSTSGFSHENITETSVTNNLNANNPNNAIQMFSRYIIPTSYNQHERADNNEISNEFEIDEKQDFVDLDLCQKTVTPKIGIPSSSNISVSNEYELHCNIVGASTTSVSSSSNINSDHLLVTGLNIRTDEKMPAKGEISEQESNGDIENSWSQPIYSEVTYKYSNSYDVSHESWSLSHDNFFNPQSIHNSRRHQINLNSELEENDVKPNLPGTSSECINETAISSASVKKIKKRKKPSTLFSDNTNLLDAVNTSVNHSRAAVGSTASTSRSANNSTVITKKKAYQCDHCSLIFVKLKERNHHMVVMHQYKRVNRRLIREAPSSTVTSATAASNALLSTNGNFENENMSPEESKQLIFNESEQSYILSSEYIKTENEFPESSQPIIDTTIIETATEIRTEMHTVPTDETDEKKPDLSIVATKTTISAHFPRTKYDSIRTNIYRLLMNFNLGVLKQNSNIEVDEKLFNSKSFCCMVCKRDFISVKHFDEHLSEHPAECFTCGKKFSRWAYFSIHLKRHIGWKDFGCSVCQKKFVIRSALVEHMRVHTGVTPLNCNLCPKSFKRYSNLTQHKRVCHSKKSVRKKDYVCYCGEVLPTKARFIWHKEIHDAKPKCCPYCCDRFIHANSLRRHIRLAHADKFAYNEPAQCPICNNIYAKTSLKSHIATHSMETQHECAICNKTFSTKWNLKIHSWVHANRTAKPFKCEHCTKAFVREIDYKNHINAHKQIRPYTCEYCGCKFIRKYNYLRHRREHHGQKKFSCDLCGKLFHRHYYLIEHRRIHTGERPFLCTICGKSSTTKTNHNKHLKIHHSRDPFTSEA